MNEHHERKDENKKISQSGVFEDDEEYERRIYEQQKLEKVNREAEIRRRQREYERQRAEQLQKEKLELMKLKSGVIEQSEIIKEEHEEKRELTFKEKLANFWYHYKIPVIVITLALMAVGYITYDTLSREKPDVYVLCTCANGIDFKLDKLEEYFESFCPDVNGDGKIHVQIISAPSSEDFQLNNASQAKISAQLQTTDTIFVLTDDERYDLTQDVDEFGHLTEDSYIFAGTLKNLTLDFPDNDSVDKKGYHFDGESIKAALGWEDMPENMVLSLRWPKETLSGDIEDMQKNYDIAFEMLEKIMKDNGDL